MKKLAMLMLLFAVALCVPAANAVSVVIGLGTSDSFGVLAGSGVTNTGNTVINGNVGSSPTPTITGFPPGDVNGIIYRAAGPVVAQAQLDLTAAYNVAAAAQDGNNISGVDLSGRTLDPNIYVFTTTASFSSGNLTLNAGGDPNAKWLFKIGSTLTTAADFNVVLINGAQANNVFWQVGTTATIGIRNIFVGSILANTNITLNGTGTLNGRALARNGAVTISTAENINVPNFVLSNATVPNVTGQTQAEANTAITGAGLAVGTITHAFSNTVAAGNVISQSPVGGTAAAGGSAVNLVISSGPAVAAVLVYKFTTAAGGVQFSDANENKGEFIKGKITGYLVFDVNLTTGDVIVPGNTNDPTVVIYGKSRAGKAQVKFGGGDPNSLVTLADLIKFEVLKNGNASGKTGTLTNLLISDVPSGFNSDIEVLSGKNSSVDIGLASKADLPKSLTGEADTFVDSIFINATGDFKANLDSKYTKNANAGSKSVAQTVVQIQLDLTNKGFTPKTILEFLD